MSFAQGRSKSQKDGRKTVAALNRYIALLFLSQTVNERCSPRPSVDEKIAQCGTAIAFRQTRNRYPDMPKSCSCFESLAQTFSELSVWPKFVPYISLVVSRQGAEYYLDAQH